MKMLSQQACEPCKKDSPVVSDDDQVTLLQQLTDWTIIERSGIKHLQKSFHVKPYTAALDLVQHIGELAESENHHPEILLEWGVVTVNWWTHSIQGLHLNDFILAARCDDLMKNLR